jgi:hypothetical protein
MTHHRSIVLLMLLTACVDGDSDPSDDSAAGDTSGNGSSSPGSAEITELSDPCLGGGTPYGLHLSSEMEGWVGCGNGFGLHHSTDGGASFSSGHDSTDLYVFDIVEQANGELLICGHDYDLESDGVMLYRGGAEGWEPLLSYGNNDSDDTAVYMSNCGAVAASGDGTIIVASQTSGDITWSTDDGSSWHKEERYWEDENLNDGYSFYYMLNLVAADGSYFGAGSKIDEPPVFFTPSSHAAGDFYNFEAVVIDDTAMGEIWGLATPDDGSTWLAGGRNQDTTSVASGFLYRSTDSGQSWDSLSLGDEIDVVHDIEFSDDGQRGVAVGHRYPTSKGGFVLLTADGGKTWSEADSPGAPLLYTAAVSGDVFWIAGDGYLAEGRF